MILILSEEEDISTDKVCEWLNKYNCEYLRVNTNINILYEINISSYYKSNIILFINNKKYDLNNFTCIWCRRGNLGFSITNNKLAELNNHQFSQIKTLEEYIYYKFKQIKSINNPSCYNINKLLVLDVAKQIGFKIPNTLICRYKDQILNFLHRNNNNIITKNIQDTIFINSPEYGVSSNIPFKVKTKQLSSDLYNYSLFQENISYKYELRLFVFLDLYYGGIKRNNTSNILEPFKISNRLKQLVLKLMNRLNLNSGSLDILIDKNNNYILLEINPVGQFDFLSVLCNYNFENEIAIKLIEYANGNYN